MDNIEKKAAEVRERMKAQRVMKITNDLHERGLLPPKKITAMEDDMLSWNNEQLEAMERFILMAVDHAKMKKALHEAKIELQAQNATQESLPSPTAVDRVSEEINKMVSAGTIDPSRDFPGLIEQGLDQAAVDLWKDKSAGEKMHEASKKDLENMAKRHEDLHEKAEKVQVAESEMIDKAVDEMTSLIQNADNMEPHDIAISKEISAAMVADEATKLAHEMTRVGLIDNSGFEGQVEEMKTWEPDAFKAMWSMVEKAAKPLNEPKVEARKWGSGSDIAKENRKRKEDQFASLMSNKQVEEKEVVIDRPTVQKSIKEAFDEVKDKKSARLISKPYTKRGSIKDRKEESDRKTAEEPAFIAELREAREFLDKFDNIFADAKVDALRAQEAMLHEEQQYNGSKIHTQADNLHKLTREHMKTQRDFAIIDKIYKQAFDRFAKVDVEQASVAELEQALKDYQAADEHTDIDALFGGKYRTGDDPYYKWLARKKKFISAEEAAELFTDMVNNFPEEAAEVFRKDKRSAGAFTQASPNKLY